MKKSKSYIYCLQKKRKHSEWFTLDKKDVEYIKGLCDEL